MGTTIDHLRVDHRVTVLRDFTDANGLSMRAGDSGVVRRLGWDAVRMEIQLVIECPDGEVSLAFPMRATAGPRIGHLREFFELGEDVTAVRVLPVFHDPLQRRMITPVSPQTAPAPMRSGAWSRVAQSTEGPDRLEAIEMEMQASIDHIGVAASIAEIYAERMRAFQRAGDEARAIAAFKLAVDWMGRYAGSATSGGEGAALSLERDRFQKALALEFGYDPTEAPQ